jgi:hypothetical protein
MDSPKTIRTLTGRSTLTAIPAFNRISADSYSRSHLVALNCKVLDLMHLAAALLSGAHIFDLRQAAGKSCFRRGIAFEALT